jgi:hypothetical protein
VSADHSTADGLPLRSQASLRTPRAAAFLFKLAKHFAKKAQVQQEASEAAQIQFPFGHCELLSEQEGQVLRFVCRAADLERQQQLHRVLGLHLDLLTRHEPVQLQWEALTP